MGARDFSDLAGSPRPMVCLAVAVGSSRDAGEDGTRMQLTYHGTTDELRASVPSRAAVHNAYARGEKKSASSLSFLLYQNQQPGKSGERKLTTTTSICGRLS